MSLTILISLLLIVISLDFKINGFVMKMIPINSPDLKILPQHFTTQERHQFLTNISISRVHRRTKNSISPNAIKSPVYVAASSYYVTPLTFGRGRGRLSTYMLLDTASHETWVQCEGCDPCIELANSNFHYMDSPSFTKMSLYDPMCHPYIEYDGSCGFETTYGLEARTLGFVGRDTFYFEMATTGSHMIPVPRVAFGCGLHNENFNFGSNNGPHNIIAGIHGLSPGPRSFLNQLSNLIKGRFSYCLVSYNFINVAHSQMYFGDYADISGDDLRTVQTISMLDGPYHLYLNGISVDGTNLPIDPSIFELDTENFRRGFFIDSGTPFTVLAKSAYNPLKDALAEYFSNNYDMHPMETEEDLCYTNNLSDIPNFPSVTLHFELHGHADEIDWTLDRDNVFRIYSENGGFCLAIIDVDDPGPNLFGAYQQANFHILYDVENGLLSFVPASCQEATT